VNKLRSLQILTTCPGAPACPGAPGPPAAPCNISNSLYNVFSKITERIKPNKTQKIHDWCTCITILFNSIFVQGNLKRWWNEGTEINDQVRIEFIPGIKVKIANEKLYIKLKFIQELQNLRFPNKSKILPCFLLVLMVLHFLAFPVVKTVVNRIVAIKI